MWIINLNGTNKMFNTDVNMTAVTVAAFISLVFGLLWHGPLFGKKWRELSGLRHDMNQKINAKTIAGYLFQFAGQYMMAFVLAQFIVYMDAYSLLSGLTVGLWAWFGFIAAVNISSYLSNGRIISPQMFVLENGYWLGAILIISGIVSTW